MLYKKSKPQTSVVADSEGLDVCIIGNRDAFLIVSNKGHFDFRVDQRSVFGKVFDAKDRSFLGKSPVFVLSSGNRRIKFKCEKTECDNASITLISSQVKLCFTVDVNKKELLARVISNAPQKEYVLCVGGHKISVNSQRFDLVCKELSKITRNEKQKYGVREEDIFAHKLFLFSCFWNVFADVRLTSFHTIKDYKRLVSPKRILCVAFAGAFSCKSRDFAKQLLCYGEFIKNVYKIELDLCFFDPNKEYARFLKQNKLKSFSKDEFELLCVYSVGVVELALDFDSRILYRELTAPIITKDAILSGKKKIGENNEHFVLKKGIMRVKLTDHALESVLIGFKDVGILTLHNFDVIANFDGKRGCLFEKSELQNICGNFATYQTGLGLMSIGVDDQFPFLLIYIDRMGENSGTDLCFSMNLSGVEISSQMLRKTSSRFATVLTPMIYENEKLNLFVLKKQNKQGTLILIGTFLANNDALLYKAMEKYPSAEALKSKIEAQHIERMLSVSDLAMEDPRQRFAVAQAICNDDHPKARACIIWALCSQNIDGSFLCDGSVAKALALYLEKSNDFNILFLELPYTFEGKFTTKKENVFMHVMRASEYLYNNEDENALEYLKKLYYDAK